AESNGQEGQAQAKAPPPSASASPEAPSPPDAQLLTSVGATTWIWPRPKVSGIFLGYIRHGQSARLRDAAIVKGEGCSKGFYAVEPRGYVCRDSTVTLAPD